MSKKKERARKVAREIDRLNNEKEKVEKQLRTQKKERNKQFHIRNLRITGHTLNFLLPFIVSAGITVGAFKLFGGGLPFYTDEIKKYKFYDLDYDTKGYISMVDYYRTISVMDDEKTSSLVVYSPWEEKDGQYVRFRRYYNLDSLVSQDLFNAVLDNNYQFIEENIPKYKEEIQTSNQINEEEKDGFIIQAELHIRDTEDMLVMDESELKNIIITIIELVLGLGIGGFFAYFRDFEYLLEMKNVGNDYKQSVSVVIKTKEKLDTINQKVLSLSQKKGGK